MDTDLNWLPEFANWSELLEEARRQPPAAAFASFQRLANSRMDFVRSARLDKATQRYLREQGAPAGLPTLRVALLGSSTLSHLLPGIRLGALRRGLRLDVYEGPYGLYRQELADKESNLHRFRPEVVCFALDAQHLAGADGASAQGALADLRYLWEAARSGLGCAVIQQTVLPRYSHVMGNNEDRLPQSPAAIIQQINSGLREIAAQDGVSLLSVDTWSAEDGVSQWHDAALWYASKQEIHPRASNTYGDQLGRMLAALRGRSSKCLVLDLDNTVWGGVIGDDGVEGIVLGQGTAAGEAHLALQQYARQLSQRGVILAVCSKNDEVNAFAGFDQHPEMALRRSDIACFMANWQDKATNLREIADRLNIGLDSLVFVDDNPAERALIRRELPMVAVPELPEDPAGYVSCLARAGYFEALDITAEDRDRAQLYRANAEREGLRRSVTDMGSFLDALHMELTWSSFDPASLKRVVQLINKTNQFNLTTRRYTESDVLTLMRDPNTFTLQLRLVDVYGDNGMIGLVIGRRTPGAELLIDTWLMSCRVLGRQVEEATLNLVAEQARDLRCTSVLGEYRPTAKNGMVREHYRKLGFELQQEHADGDVTWTLMLDRFIPRATHMLVREGTTCKTPESIAS